MANELKNEIIVAGLVSMIAGRMSRGYTRAESIEWTRENAVSTYPRAIWSRVCKRIAA